MKLSIGINTPKLTPTNSTWSFLDKIFAAIKSVDMPLKSIHLYS